MRSGSVLDVPSRAWGQQRASSSKRLRDEKAREHGLDRLDLQAHGAIEDERVVGDGAVDEKCYGGQRAGER